MKMMIATLLLAMVVQDHAGELAMNHTSYLHQRDSVDKSIVKLTDRYMDRKFKMRPVHDTGLDSSIVAKVRSDKSQNITRANEVKRAAREAFNGAFASSLARWLIAAIVPWVFGLIFWTRGCECAALVALLPLVPMTLTAIIAIPLQAAAAGDTVRAAALESR
eukprot:gnl/TRDRNA2_/TRDRNA2_190930_c0_seq1.p1 gnl/TRDRNA2_/TRDRNA2_190930_c0~~gnl/TRDRNA2_/TRDRNA2_190930_c0_seq1.p1  ORF type:complete len:163 (+),score=22.13 gnl/TRDRNA2_/TRDRNA2_190930_c0_seq1:84-572(+)